MSREQLEEELAAQAAMENQFYLGSQQAAISPGQERWAHYTNMERSSVMLVRGSSAVATINEDEDGHEFEAALRAGSELGGSFGSSFHDQQGYVPPSHVPTPRSAGKKDGNKANRKVDSSTRKAMQRSRLAADHVDSNQSLVDPVDGRKNAPASTSAPPVARSVDILPNIFSSGQPSNVVMDDMVSMVTERTDHSANTTQFRNTRDDQSFRTTSTMATTEVRNRGNTRIFSPAAPLEFETTSVAATSATQDSNVTPLQGHAGQHPADAQPFTVSNEELIEMWERFGKCTKCGVVQTHEKETYGPFGLLWRMKPLTVEGQCYDGYCLRCHDIRDLHGAPVDANAPPDHPEHDPNYPSYPSMQAGCDGELEGKPSPVVSLCSSTKYQIVAAIVLLGLIGALLGLTLTLTKGTEPGARGSLPPSLAPSYTPPTSSPSDSPTTYAWTAVSELARDDVESFGHHVSLSSDGQILAVASPKYAGSRGRVDVYLDVANGSEWAEIGDALVGEETGDDLGFGMSLSGDGSTIAVGSPGYNQGLVRVYRIDPKLGLVQKGQSLLGSTPMSQYGYSIALNHAGDKLFVGAPQYGESIQKVYGMVQVFHFDDQHWVQLGPDIIGPAPGSRFGHSIATDEDGLRVTIGAPLDDEKWENAGQIHWKELRDDEWVDVIRNKLYGAEEGSMFGAQVSTSEDGIIVITGCRDGFSEDYPNAGVLSIWGLDDDYRDANIVGFPLSGTHENAMMGYDTDSAASGTMIVVSGKNGDDKAGSIRVFVLHLGRFIQYGPEMFGPELGEKNWLGGGPSVAMATRNMRVAVGYENILSEDGVSQPAVRIYDYYAASGGYNPYA